MCNRYKDSFSSRDEIATCSNTEVVMEVIDNSPFFIIPFHVKEEDKPFLDKEMDRLADLGILKEVLLHILHLLCSIVEKSLKIKDVLKISDI